MPRLRVGMGEIRISAPISNLIIREASLGYYAGTAITT